MSTRCPPPTRCGALSTARCDGSSERAVWDLAHTHIRLDGIPARRALIECRSMSAPMQERRAPRERRHSVLRALWHGNFARRRVAPRRLMERHVVVTDWFQPHWLAITILILLLCSADALLTLSLIARGGQELNPFMDPLVRGSGHAFAVWKFGLTATGVVFLTLLARLRVFGRAVGTLLYIVLAMYAVLVGYELFLLQNIPL